MKNKILIFAILIAGLLNSCSSDVYDAPNSFSDVGFYTSSAQQPSLKVNIDRFITFSDLSQGAKSHKWSIGAGNVFLEGSIRSTDTIFDKYMQSGMDTITALKTVSVLFKKDGIQKVRLYNTFKDSVAFRGFANGKNYIKPAIKVGNEWVMDTIFLVDVYARIAPALELKQNGVIKDHTKKDTIYVEAGDVLNFKDITTIGRPTGTYWSIVRALKPGVVQTAADLVGSSTLKETDILFKKLGVFNAFLTSSRSGQNIPSASKRIAITTPIKVIPSSKPFIQTGAIKELENETIQIPFNGEFAPFIGQENFFKVKVNGVNFSVKSVGISPKDGTVIDLVLNAKIYRPDVITISYTGGNLTSTDTRKLVAFTDVPVAMHDVNLLPASVASMEDGGNKGKDSWAARWDNKGKVEFSTVRAFSGKTSMKLSFVAGESDAKAEVILTDAIILDASKTYILQYRVWVESSTVLPTESGLYLLNNWGWQMWRNFGFPQGEWKTQTADYKSGTPVSSLFIRVLANGARTSNIVAYYDDFYLVEKEVRP